MRSRSSIAVVSLVCVAAATVTGFAASIGGVTARGLGADTVSVPSCDADGFTAAYTTSAGNVTSVTLGAIADPGCEGGVLSLVLANATGTSIGAGGGTIATDGDTADNSMVVTLTPTPAASAVTAIHVAVAGP